MITHLISTTEFVKLVYKQYWFNNITNEKALEIVANYANFISQKPELWMFVPCDEDGEVIPELKYTGYKEGDIYWLRHKEILEKAQSKILFKDLFLQDNNFYKWVDDTNIYLPITVQDILEANSIEELIFDELELTETALKQIGLI